MSFPRYSKYKASGVEWLGDVPEHWGIHRIKHSILSCKNGIWGDEAQGDEHDIPCVRVADFDRQRLRVELVEPTIRNVLPNERNGRIISQGDLLLEKSGGGEQQPVGCIVYYDDSRPAVCSNFVARIQLAEGMNATYWKYLHAAAYSVRLNAKSIKQTSGIQNLDQQQYFDELAGFPPPDEQSLIAGFLEDETEKIHGLVSDQQRLIELLKEKRQAVISHAVTKGLNPDVPLKESGLHWIGQVPEHWTLPPLYARYDQVLGKMLDQSKITGEYSTPYLRNQDVRWDWINVEELPVMDIRPEEKERFTVRRGDLLTVEGRELGRAAIWNGDDNVIAFQKALHRLRPRDLTENPRFFYYTMVFANGTNVFLANQAPNEIPHLTGEQLRCYRFPKPPADEQAEIVEFLDQQTQAFDALKAEAERAIELLQERRTAMISAAVTGKIDVRGWTGKASA